MKTLRRRRFQVSEHMMLMRVRARRGLLGDDVGFELLPRTPATPTLIAATRGPDRYSRENGPSSYL